MAGDGLLVVMRRRYEVRRSLTRLQSLMQPGSYQVYPGAALSPAGPDGQLDDYQLALQANMAAGCSRPTRWAAGWSYKIAPRSGVRDYLYDTLIQRRDWIILVAKRRDHVLRLTSRPELAARLTHNAEWLRRSFPVPWIEATSVGLAGLYGVREAFVAGQPIRSAKSEQWDSVFRQLLAACQKHVAWRQGSFDYTPVLAELSSWQVPTWLERALGKYQQDIKDLLDGCPLLAGHSDCHNGNVVVQPDGNLILIDLERVQSLPFFFDALSLLRGSGKVNVALRQAYLAGQYDAEMASLWAAAGQPWQPRWRIAALLAMTVAHAFRPQFCGATSERRREKLIGAADKIRHDCRMD